MTFTVRKQESDRERERVDKLYIHRIYFLFHSLAKQNCVDFPISTAIHMILANLNYNSPSLTTKHTHTRTPTESDADREKKITAIIKSVYFISDIFSNVNIAIKRLRV